MHINNNKIIFIIILNGFKLQAHYETMLSFHLFFSLRSLSLSLSLDIGVNKLLYTFKIN